MSVWSWSLPPILFLVVSCAKVGDPLPPLVRFPDPVEVRLVQQARDCIELLIPPPLEAIKEVEIYRECGKSLSAEFEGALLARVGRERLERLSPTGFIVLEDPEPIYSEHCRYQVRVRNEQGQRSLPSNTVQTSLSSPPGVPNNLRVEVQERQLVVTWDAPLTNLDGSKPAEVVGYLINSVHVVTDTRFIDREFVFGKTVSYSVQSIGNLEQPSVLSIPSQKLEVVPMDRFAPAAPGNLTAVPLDSKVQLLWDAVADSGLSGYFLYRGSAPERLQRLSPLVTINRYVDPDPPVGSVSYYAVTAVDNGGNESVFSNYVTVTVNP